MRYKSIFQDEETSRYCFFCGRVANHWHHIFNASDKRNSEHYGLMLRVCWQCHEKIHGGVYDGKDDDFTRLSMVKVKKYGQRKAMEQYGFTLDEWRRIFYKNYL